MAKIIYPNKLNLAQLPTPIVYMERLSKLASRHGNVRIYIKRDDLTHGPAAGNKIRKLEFLLADAKAKKANVILTCGGLQSNHARATAILARELGMETVLFLRGERPLHMEGNFFLDQLVGARVIFVSAEQYENIHSTFQAMVQSYRSEKITAYIIPEGGSNELGSMGYVACMEEVSHQCGTNGLPSQFNSVVCATGSGGTYAGLLTGRNLLGWDDGRTNVFTFNVCRTAQEFKMRIINLLVGTIQKNQLPISFMADDINIIDGYVGPGYAQTTPELMDFILEVSQKDGILLDPVYTGKALFGLISELKNNADNIARFGENILFVHTGGMPSLFGFQKQFEATIEKS